MKGGRETLLKSMNDSAILSFEQASEKPVMQIHGRYNKISLLYISSGSTESRARIDSIDTVGRAVICT